MLVRSFLLSFDGHFVEGAHGQSFARLGVSLTDLLRVRPLLRVIIHLPRRLIARTPLPAEGGKPVFLLIVARGPLHFDLRVFARLVLLYVVGGFG